jgi:hypothetical protein
MKTRFPLALPLVLAALSLPAVAHDPKLHKHDGAAAPDCSHMQDTDMSKMDMNDPVMMAMHEKCKGSMKHDGMQGHDMKNMDMKDTPGMDKKMPPPTDKDKK